MALTSTAEARFDARVRPEIRALRSRTSYPGRRRWPGPGPSRLGSAAALRPGGTAALRPGGAAALRPGSTAALRPGGAAALRPGGTGTTRLGPNASEPAAPLAAWRPADSPQIIRPVTARRPVARIGRACPRLVHLTRRGRLVASAMLLACVIAAAVTLWLAVAHGARAASGTGPARPGGAGMERVVVRPGQTLWSIAVATDPSADPRAVIGAIIADNGLHGMVIQPGQVLWVPRG